MAKIWKFLIGSIGLVASVKAYSASADSNVVVYWGQNSYGNQERLQNYCTDDVDVVVLSFLTVFFGTGGMPEINFANQCSGSYFDGTELLHCSTIGEDIQTCQGKGKKILLSLGGASGSYGFDSDSEAQTFAGTLNDLFGTGSSDTRPFDSAVVDGFDLDIEAGSSTGYGAFVNEMRSLNPDVLISAAPQCPYPDAYVGDALDTAEFDMVFVQFYNNYCNAGGSSFNYDTWDNWAINSLNSSVKVYLGVPGSSTAASSGYNDASTVGSLAKSLQASYSSFGGVMIWDASQAFSNVQDDVTFVHSIKSSLEDSTDSTTTSYTAVVASTSSTISYLSSVTSALAEASTSETGTSAVATSSQSSSPLLPTTFVSSSIPTTIIVEQPTSTSAAQTATESSQASNGSCSTGQQTCIDGKYAQCVSGSWVLTQCGGYPETSCQLENGNPYCGWASDNGQAASASASASASATSLATSASSSPTAGTCTHGDSTCIDGKLAQCVGTSWVYTTCPGSPATVCKLENGSPICDWA